MAFLDEIVQDKEALLRLFLTDRDLVDLLTNKTNTPLPAMNLRYTQVYPYHWISSTITEQQPYLCFSVTIPRVQSPAVKDVMLKIRVFDHDGDMRTAKGPKIDLLAAAIDDILNGRKGMGIGEVSLRSVEEIFPAPNFFGYVMTYSVKDFNRSFREIRERGIAP